MVRARYGPSLLCLEFVMVRDLMESSLEYPMSFEVYSLFISQYLFNKYPYFITVVLGIKMSFFPSGFSLLELLISPWNHSD